MNENPYLHWAKKIRLTNWFLDCLASAQVDRQARHARFREIYHGDVLYTERELRSARVSSAANQPIDWASYTSSYNSTPEIKD